MLTDITEDFDRPDIKIAVGRDGVVMRLFGRIDIEFSPTIRDRLLALVETSNAKPVGIDLSAVTHIDSSGIATLIEALRMARASKTSLRLQGLQGRLLRLFEITGLLNLFNGNMSQSECKAI